MSKTSIPIISKSYKFYDDGKITPGRRSTATVLEVLSTEEVFVQNKCIDVENPELFEEWCKEANKHLEDYL